MRSRWQRRPACAYSDEPGRTAVNCNPASVAHSWSYVSWPGSLRPKRSAANAASTSRDGCPPADAKRMPGRVCVHLVTLGVLLHTVSTHTALHVHMTPLL